MIVSIILLYLLLFQMTFSYAVENDAFLNELIAYKAEHDIIGEDAYCDNVFKLVPGFDSKIMDVEATYKLTKHNKIIDPRKIVYKEIKHKTIDDLTCGPIYKGNPKVNKVSIIINVAWGEEYLDDMLQILENNNVTVNFFVEGRWALKNLECLFKIYSKNHLIGNHSYSHADFSRLSKDEAYKEIMETNRIIEGITNYKTRYFGPPSGAFKEETINITNNLNMKTLMWSIDTIDWQKPSVATIKERVIPKLENGSIILMHPTQNTKDALDDIIKAIKNKNLELTTLDRLLY